MKIDLHCHSKYSNRPTLWIMQKLGCPESFTEPAELYALLRAKGMGAVTVTDHNDIRACLDIAHLPNTFTGCEYTTYFPDDECKVHVLAYGFTEAQHEDMMKARENIFDLVEYFHQNNIRHACAHPLYGPNARLNAEHVEMLALLFKHWELNGDQNPEMNEALRAIMDCLTPEHIARLWEKHGVAPRGEQPWEKIVTAGSDDHSSLNLGSAYTEVKGAQSIEEFWRGLDGGRGNVYVTPACPESFAHNVYGIAYQFYKSKLALDRHVNKDILLRFLDRILQTRAEGQEPWMNRVYLALAKRRRTREEKDAPLLALARAEAEKLIRKDPALMAIVGGNGEAQTDRDRQWFDFVEQMSNRMILQLGGTVIDRVVHARLFDLFNTVGSAGALYTLMAPYFVSYSHYMFERRFSRDVLAHFNGGALPPALERVPRVAHFTDTFIEVNGVARTIQQQLDIAAGLKKEYSVLACFAKPQPARAGLCAFNAAGSFSIPEYPEIELLAPPFLQMLKHCYDAQYTHLHLATPGPVGLAGLGIARILQLPVSATYHTAFPEYAATLTDDAYVEDVAWKYMLWFYDQMDTVYVPSRATAAELIQRGLNADKIKIYPRGVDTERFHPAKRNGILQKHFHAADGPVNFLYVGRISKEKNLPLLVKAYESLIAKGHHARLVVVGDGPYRAEMQLALRYTPALFTGTLEGEQLAAIYASCDALVFPSTTDTFGNVVLEAQASGIPVVVSNLGGPVENVRAGVTGYVVEANELDPLVEAMQALAVDAARRAAMGVEARAFMEGRAFQPAFDRLFAMYTGASPAQAPRDGVLPFSNLVGSVSALAC